MKSYFLTLGILLFAGVAAQPALADSFYLVGTNDSTGAPCSTTAPCAKVTINTSGDTATFTVTSLDSGYVFDNFGFNFSGPGTLSLTSDSGEVHNPSLSGPGASELGGFGKFKYVFDTGKNGGSNGGDCSISGSTISAGCTFSFTVTDSMTSSVLTDAEFETDTNGTHTTDSYFAGHIAASNASGFVDHAVPVPPIPEPSSLMLLGSGVLGLAGVVRRRCRC